MVLRIVVGLLMTVAALALAGRRLWWLGRLGRAGQPAPERIEAVRSHVGRDVEVQAEEVFGQRKLLKWTIPGVAHFVTFWGFIILIFTIIEAYGDLFSRGFAIPGIGHSFALGFLEDLFAVLVLAGLITFAVDPAPQRSQARGPGVPVRRVAHRRGLARAGHDLPGRSHAAAVQGRADQHRVFPLPARRVRVADRRALAAPRLAAG